MSDTKKFPKRLSLKVLVVTLALFASATIAPELHPAFAGNYGGDYTWHDPSGNHEDYLVTQGKLDEGAETFTMKARGKHYYGYWEDGGDQDVSVSGNAVHVNDALVEFHFNAPSYMYDNRLIKKMTVKVKYDNADSGCSQDKYCDDRPSELLVWRWDELDWCKWEEFADTGDGSYKWIQDYTTNIYPDDNHMYLGGLGRMVIGIEAPDGAGTSTDDDANLDIHEVHVVLHLKQDSPGILTTTGSANGQQGDEAEYTLTAKGKDIWKILPGEKVNIAGDDLELSDGWVEYAFKAPDDLYDYRVIRKIKVQVNYHNADAGDSSSGNEDLPPEVYLFDWKGDVYLYWNELSVSGSQYEGSSSNLYPTDSR